MRNTKQEEKPTISPSWMRQEGIRESESEVPRKERKEEESQSSEIKDNTHEKGLELTKREEERKVDMAKRVASWRGTSIMMSEESKGDEDSSKEKSILRAPRVLARIWDAEDRKMDEYLAAEVLVQFSTAAWGMEVGVRECEGTG